MAKASDGGESVSFRVVPTCVSIAGSDGRFLSVEVLLPLKIGWLVSGWFSSDAVTVGWPVLILEILLRGRGEICRLGPRTLRSFALERDLSRPQSRRLSDLL
jgi:hypothetical protein